MHGAEKGSILTSAGSFPPRGLRLLLEKAEPDGEGGARSPGGAQSKATQGGRSTEPPPAGHLVLKAPVTQRASILALFQVGSKRNPPNPS